MYSNTHILPIINLQAVAFLVKFQWQFQAQKVYPAGQLATQPSTISHLSLIALWAKRPLSPAHQHHSLLLGAQQLHCQHGPCLHCSLSLGAQQLCCQHAPPLTLVHRSPCTLLHRCCTALHPHPRPALLLPQTVPAHRSHHVIPHVYFFLQHSSCVLLMKYLSAFLTDNWLYQSWHSEKPNHHTPPTTMCHFQKGSGRITGGKTFFPMLCRSFAGPICP